MSTNKLLNMLEERYDELFLVGLREGDKLELFCHDDNTIIAALSDTHTLDECAHNILTESILHYMRHHAEKKEVNKFIKKLIKIVKEKPNGKDIE